MTSLWHVTVHCRPRILAYSVSWYRDNVLRNYARSATSSLRNSIRERSVELLMLLEVRLTRGHTRTHTHTQTRCRNITSLGQTVSVPLSIWLAGPMTYKYRHYLYTGWEREIERRDMCWLGYQINDFWLSGAIVVITRCLTNSKHYAIKPHIYSIYRAHS